MFSGKVLLGKESGKWGNRRCMLFSDTVRHGMLYKHKEYVNSSVFYVQQQKWIPVGNREMFGFVWIPLWGGLM